MQRAKRFSRKITDYHYYHVGTANCRNTFEQGAEKIAGVSEQLNEFVQETVGVANAGSQLMTGTTQAIIEAAQSKCFPQHFE